MAFELTGRRTAGLAAILLVAVGLGACTTTEGTNAFTSVDTFEREVMNTTAQGLGLVPKEVKPDPTNPRAPLVLPKSTANLPPPTEDTVTAQLPADSDTVQVDASGLTQDELNRARHARVVDVNTPDGRPLTQAELQKLTAKMKAYRLSDKRSIFVPPEQYFELSGNKEDLVCLAPNGDLVPVNDPTCPLEIRKALLKKA
jgi:hypothetical protein